MLGVVLFGARLHRIVLRKRGVIVLFHRVDDIDPGNPLECSPAQFEAFCEFFKRSFDVISLTELLDRLEAGADLGGTLVITFDDGYLDNRLVAAPILHRLSLPACFFVTTGFIGTTTTTWWDAERGIAPPWMAWSHVKDLVKMGFEVGAHTVNHVDLGQVHGEQARAEIADSGRHLQRELGLPVPLFSYPYGRHEQITQANRSTVRTLGFRCCLSAFGGIVRSGSDPYELRRMPVTPGYVSPHELGWEILRAGY